MLLTRAPRIVHDKNNIKETLINSEDVIPANAGIQVSKDMDARLNLSST